MGELFCEVCEEHLEVDEDGNPDCAGCIALECPHGGFDLRDEYEIEQESRYEPDPTTDPSAETS